jgi:hypothetical protein
MPGKTCASEDAQFMIHDHELAVVPRGFITERFIG